MNITTGGLAEMAKIFISCRPICGGVLDKNKSYLIQCAKFGSDFEFDDLIAKLPSGDAFGTYRKIAEFAEREGYRVVDEECVWRYFGETDHIEKVLQDIEDSKVGPDFASKILFTHLVMPVEIISVREELYDGVYRNGNHEILLQNLVPLCMQIPFEQKLAIKVGDVVLVHYASIISPRASEKIAKSLLQSQSRHERFSAACSGVTNIDFKKFWNLCDWTKGIIREKKNAGV